jgi:TonB family protein
MWQRNLGSPGRCFSRREQSPFRHNPRRSAAHKRLSRLLPHGSNRRGPWRRNSCRLRRPARRQRPCRWQTGSRRSSSCSIATSATPATAPRDEERIVKVYFSLDRSGRVMDSHIISSSGSSAVDEEALALMRRSEPFPATSQELKDRVKDAADPFRSTISITKAPTPIRPGPVSTK